MSKQKTLGEIIKTGRKKRDLSQRKLASLLEIHFTYLSKIENNKTDVPPSAELLKKLAKYLRLDADEILYLSGRIPADIKIIYSKLYIDYGDRIPKLFRQMNKDPVFAQKVFNVL